MGEMDRSAKTPSQLLGDLDRLHRHFREVDWDDDVLNVQRFHAHSMKSLQLGGSALLGKPRAFLALRFSYKPSPGNWAGKQQSDAFTHTSAGRNPRPELGWRLAKNAFERSIELRE